MLHNPENISAEIRVYLDQLISKESLKKTNDTELINDIARKFMVKQPSTGKDIKDWITYLIDKENDSHYGVNSNLKYPSGTLLMDGQKIAIVYDDKHIIHVSPDNHRIIKEKFETNKVYTYTITTPDWLF